MSNDISVEKHCYTCKSSFPNTPEFFTRNKRRKDGLDEHCRACINASARRRRNPAKHRAASIRWNKENKERVAAYNLAWKRENPEKTRQYYKAWEQNNLAEKREMERQYRKNNRDKILAKNHRQRARRRNCAINDFTYEQWVLLQAKFKYCCAYCGKRCKGKMTQDHITPLNNGGNHTASNIVPACRSCNSKKNDGPVLSPVQPLLIL